MWHAVRHILEHRARGASWGKQSAAAHALERATAAINELFVPDVAAKIRPRSVQHAALTVDVEHPAYVVEVRKKEKEILRRVTSGAAPVNRLQISVRRFTHTPESPGR